MRVIIDYLGTKHDLTGLSILLFFSGFGLLYKRINNAIVRKWTGTLLGLLMAILFFGQHLWHFLLAGIATICAIRAAGPKICHLVAFAMMFLYITMFRIVCFSGQERIDDLINLLLMMLTFKIVGVAFEIHAADKFKETTNESDQKILNYSNLTNLTFFDIFHYAFSYLGLLTGPYFRYQVYEDFITLPFSKNVNNLRFVLWKLSQVLIFTVIQLTFQSYWPLEYIFEESFNHRSLSYRCIFAVLQWQRFKFWIYLGLSVAECISGAAGLGSYPVQGNSTTSYGPTENREAMKEISDEEAKHLMFDFKTITTIKIFEYEMSPTLVDSVRVWNMSIQYWLAMYIYRNIPKAQYTKTQRALVTTMVCALWHSVDAGIVLSVLWLTFYLKTEQIYIKILKSFNNSRILTLFKLGMWTARFFMCPFCLMPFLLESVNKIYFYLSSIYFLPLVVQICFHLIGFKLLSRMNKKTE